MPKKWFLSCINEMANISSIKVKMVYSNLDYKRWLSQWFEINVAKCYSSCILASIQDNTNSLKLLSKRKVK
jgi:hypothetical protein